MTWRRESSRQCSSSSTPTRRRPRPGEGELTESVEMAQHLLVAADRYGLERLKLMCEDTLIGRIDTANVAATLTLAEQHGCRGLKNACLSFLTGAPGNLQAVMASDDYKHLAVSCPSLHEAIASDLSAVLSGSHVLRIEGYTKTTELLSNGEGLASVAFAVGGRRWCLEYYPDGDDPENAGWVSLILRLHRTDAAVDVRASFEISLLGLDGNPVPSSNLASGSTCELSGGEGWGGGLVETEVLKLEGSGYLKDDAFSIRCDITVVK
ncbi:hypothetical protein BRADI_4g14033v3 [Brachypodium distachyon]|uniref:MATH domain-containing protein n=1 Tax=Brachypodium distachyon TaxID=15368 RepID=A0A2K2CMR5_BRADI|nr:hypothetical protein BRADI_4g14033v3 [Brachypodium distachyon]